MTERQFIAMIRAAREGCQERIRGWFSLRKRCGILRPAMAAPLVISLPRLRTHLEALSRFGRSSDGRGITRSCWGPAHEEARAWLLGRMKEAGLSTWVDEAGNTFGRLGNGGPLDGALGVLAGLECLQTIHESGARTRLPLMVAAWSDEEGRYAGLFGSRAFAGKLDVKQIPHLRAADGERLVDAMARAGFNPYDAPKARCNPKTLSAYVELHIEQGPHLEAAKIPIGVVEGIVGNRRNWVTFTGQADHAGTTPMAWRRDAFMAAAEFALRARRLIVAKGSGRSVTNFGRAEVGPGVSNIVPDRCVLLHEMRELDPRVLVRLERQCLALARSVAKKWKLKVTVDPISKSQPARCAPRVMRAVEAAAAGLKLKVKRMPSGAGHDAQNLALVTDSGMLFIPSQGGRSHRPDETSDWRAIERGANTLLHTLLGLAG